MPSPILGPVSVGDAFKCSIFQKLYGQTIMNILWYEVATVTGGPFDRWAVQEAVANQLLSAGDVVEKMNACQSLDVTNVKVRVQSFDALADRKPYTEVTNTDPGDLATGAGTSNTAASIEKRALPTALKPRTGVGRMQVGGIPSNSYTAGELNGAEVLLLQDLASQLEAPLSVLATVTLNPVLVTWGPTNILMHEIFQCVVMPTVRTMNRRTVGRGI